MRFLSILLVCATILIFGTISEAAAQRGFRTGRGVPPTTGVPPPILVLPNNLLGSGLPPIGPRPGESLIQPPRDETSNPTGGGSPPRSSNPVYAVPVFDEDDYLKDVWRSMEIVEHFEDTVVILFAADERLRLRAMRDLLRDLTIELIEKSVAKAQEVLNAQRTGFENELADVDNSVLGMFRWPTKRELRQKIDTIRQTETDVENMKQRARDEAQRNIPNYSPDPGWQSRGRLTFTLGPAYGQLRQISISGW